MSLHLFTPKQNIFIHVYDVYNVKNSTNTPSRDFTH